MDLQEDIYKKVRITDETGRQVVGFGDLSTDIFLEVQSKTYNQILYLIDYIAHGLKFRHKHENPFKEYETTIRSRSTNKIAV